MPLSKLFCAHTTQHCFEDTIEFLNQAIALGVVWSRWQCFKLSRRLTSSMQYDTNMTQYDTKNMSLGHGSLRLVYPASCKFPSRLCHNLAWDPFQGDCLRAPGCVIHECENMTVTFAGCWYNGAREIHCHS